MKITKTKEVVKEEIEVEAGTYYFKCADGEYHKMELGETDKEGITNYRCTYISNSSNIFSIKVKEDYTFNEQDLPYKFSAFIREISVKEIEKEEYDKVRKEVLSLLRKDF